MERSRDISIIMVTLNRAHLISETLESILRQSFHNWECLIIDDGSNDDTANVVEKFISKDPRFTYLNRTQNYKKGLPGCRNQGLDLAIGAFVIFFDDDDIVHPEALSSCIKVIKEKQDYSFCRFDKKPFSGNSLDLEFFPVKNSSFKKFRTRDLPKMITMEVPFASCCVIWSNKCFEIERFNEDLMYAEEWECYSRILAQGFEGVILNEVLYFNRKHPESNTGEFQKKDPVRVNAKLRASKLIIQNIGSKNLFNKELKKYFLRLGFQLNSYEIISLTLKKSKSPFLEEIKYGFGYFIYPILRPIFKLKARLKTS